MKTFIILLVLSLFLTFQGTHHDGMWTVGALYSWGATYIVFILMCIRVAVRFMQG